MVGRPRTSARIAVALSGAALLCAITATAGVVFRVRPVPKGWRAPYTMRAASDLVWNQAESHAEDVRAFVPFYDAEPGLLEQRRSAILGEISQLSAGFWRFLPDDELALPQDAGVDHTHDADRVAQVTNLAEAMFALLEPYYREGVIADAEFPAREKEIRVFAVDSPTEPEDGQEEAETPAAEPMIVTGGSYHRIPVARLHRFSELRAQAEQVLARDFPTIEPQVREQVVGWVLDRLPPNLRYSRTNADHIADRSMVTGQKAVLVRGGAVLVQRHQIVDTRVEDALRAALDVQPALRGALLAACGLVVIVTLLGGQAMALSGPQLARPWAQMVVFGAFAGVLAVSRLTLALTPLSETAAPIAAVAGVVAYRAGTRAAAVVAILGAAYATLGLAFDATTFAVTLAGGLTLALVVRPRRMGWAILAAPAAGLIQATTFAACTFMGGRPRTIDTIFSGVQALVAGVLAGVLGVLLAIAWEHVHRRMRIEDPAPTPVHATISAHERG